MSTFTAEDVRTINTIIANADLDDLKMMGLLMTQRKELIGRLNMGTVTRGQKVRFKGRNGVYITGIVEKVNRKKVIVKEELNPLQKWNVPGTMLEKV